MMYGPFGVLRRIGMPGFAPPEVEEIDRGWLQEIPTLVTVEEDSPVLDELVNHIPDLVELDMAASSLTDVSSVHARVVQVQMDQPCLDMVSHKAPRLTNVRMELD